MTPARHKDDELVQQMYKYAKALVDMTASGWVTILTNSALSCGSICCPPRA